MKKSLILLILISLCVIVSAQTSLGIKVEFLRTDKNPIIRILNILPGSLAQYNDLKTGDKIISINDNFFKSQEDLEHFFQKDLTNYNFTIQRENKRLYKSIKVNPTQRVFIGIILITKNRNVVINKIFPNSPASNANLKEGDIILKIDNQKIVNPYQVGQILNQAGFGSRVKFFIKNGNRLLNKDVTLYRWMLPDEFSDSDKKQKIEYWQRIINIIKYKKASN